MSIILPRKKDGRYLISYSQINSFLTNKKQYFKSYFYGQPIEFTAYIDFGSKVGSALEKNDFKEFAKSEQHTLKKVPRLDEFERKITYHYNEFDVIGFIDTNKKDLSKTYDYKTGTKSKIKEYQSDKYIQPYIYALGLKQEHGVTPDEMGVILIERLGNAYKGEPLVLGEEIWEIPLEISAKKLQYAENLVYRTAIEISNYYKAFLKMNKII